MCFYKDGDVVIVAKSKFRRFKSTFSNSGVRLIDIAEKDKSKCSKQGKPGKINNMWIL